MRKKRSAVSKKIAKLIREGKTKEQAAGEAYGMARSGRLTPEGGYIHARKKKRMKSRR